MPSGYYYSGDKKRPSEKSNISPMQQNYYTRQPLPEQNYYAPPPQPQQMYYNQPPLQQPQGYYQQQPIYVQQQPPSRNNDDCLTACLAGLCICCTLDLLF